MTEHCVPRTVAVTDKEGGVWIPFNEFRGGTVHSIKFDDGKIWDCVNGWRMQEISPRFAHLGRLMPKLPNSELKAMA